MCYKQSNSIGLKATFQTSASHFFFFFFSIESPLMVLITFAQSALRGTAGYKWTLYVSYTIRNIVREPDQKKKYLVVAFTFRTVVQTRQKR